MTDEVDNTKFDFSDFNISDETDKRFREASEAELPDFKPPNNKLQTNLLNPLNKYTLEDICEWVADKDGKLTIVYLHDRLANKIIKLEHIHKTDMGIYIYFDNYYQKISQRKNAKNNPINHIINKAYEENSIAHNKAINEKFPLGQLPSKKITVAFKNEINNSIIDKLPLENFSDIFNTVPFKDEHFSIIVKNGVLNIKTLQLEKFSPEIMLTNKIDVDFINIAENEQIKKHYEEFCTYIHSMVAEEKDYIRLQELYSVGLTKVPILKTSGWLKGPSDSGKSTMNNIIKQVIGNKNAGSVSLHKLENDGSATSNLINVTINFSNDLGDAEIKDLETFMNILGKDEMYTRALYEDGDINSKLTMQIIVSLNDFPKGNFKYMNKFLNRIEIIMIKKVLRLKDQIMDYEKYWNNPERKSAILYWLIEGLQRLQKNGYSYPQTKDEKIDLINKDSMDSFFNECCLYSYSNDEQFVVSIDSERLLQEFNARAEKNGLEQLQLSSFHKRFNKFLSYNYKLIEYKRSDRTDSQTGKRYNIYNYKHLILKNASVIQNSQGSENELLKFTPLSYKDLILSIIKKSGDSGIKAQHLFSEIAKKDYKDQTKIAEAIDWILKSGMVYIIDSDTYLFMTDKIED